MGTRLIDSTPQATTTSCAPAMIAWAAKDAACWLEPHCRSMVVAGMCSGQPAASTAVRPMFSACSPACPTHPAITSSISAGSIPVRCARAPSTSASRSTGCTPERAPPGLPLPDAVRTTSTITASLTGRSPRSVLVVFGASATGPHGRTLLGEGAGALPGVAAGDDGLGCSGVDGPHLVAPVRAGCRGLVHHPLGLLD